jgi:hypothetical protein
MMSLIVPLHRLSLVALMGCTLCSCAQETAAIQAEAGVLDATPQSDIQANDARTEVADTGSADGGDQRLDSGVSIPDAQPRDISGSELIGGRGSCIEGMQCILGCGDDDDCSARCMEEVLPRNLEITEAIVRCAAQNNCADPTCIMRSCPSEASACGSAGGEAPEPVEDTGMPVGDNYSCADMILCVNACGADTRCFNDCLDRVRPQSARLASDLTRCMMSARCITMECGYERCPEESERCLADD